MFMGQNDVIDLASITPGTDLYQLLNDSGGSGNVSVATATLPADSAIDWDTLIQRGMDIGQGIIALEQQRDLLQTNLELAKQGRAPISASSVAPVVKVQGGLDPQTRNMLLFGLVAIGALIFFSRKR